METVVTMMYAARGYSRLAHIDGLIGSDPAVDARLPEIHRDGSRTQGLDRLELIRFPQVAQTLSVHHGALAHLLGINALHASEAAAVRIEDDPDTLRGHRVLHLVGKGNTPATCRSPSRSSGWSPGSRQPLASFGASAPAGLSQSCRMPWGPP